MSQSPEEIRAEIERTRSELGSDVDALADKVRPSSVMHRQTNKVRSGLTSIRESVMGRADDVGASAQHAAHSAADAAQHAAHSAADAVQDAPHRVSASTRGNPLAAGIIAFGAGMLLSSLIPASDVERQAAQAVKEKAQPMMDELGSVAKEVAEDMKEPVREAVEEVKSSAADSAAVVKDEATGAVQDVKYRAQEAKENL